MIIFSLYSTEVNYMQTEYHIYIILYNDKRIGDIQGWGNTIYYKYFRL